MEGIERIHIQSDWGSKERRVKDSQALEPAADEIYRKVFSGINMTLSDGVAVRECTKEDVISTYDWKDGIDLFLHTRTGHILTVQEKLLKQKYHTATFTEQQGMRPGNWYTSVAHYWFVGYAYNYPASVLLDQWVLIDLPCLKRLDHLYNMNWVIKSNNEPGYRHISFRYIEINDIPDVAIIARSDNGL